MWRKWSPEMDARLIALHAEGLSSAQIGAALGFSRQGVAARVAELRAAGVEGLPYRDPKEWTVQQVRTADAMSRNGATAAEIARAVGRGLFATKAMMGRFGITSGNKRQWTEQERKTLRRMRAQRVKIAECARRLGRSKQSVKFQLFWQRQRTKA